MVEKDGAYELQAVRSTLAWQKAGRAHFLRMLVCAGLSTIPGLWWMRFAMIAFGLAWIFCSYKFWTLKLAPTGDQA